MSSCLGGLWCALLQDTTAECQAVSDSRHVAQSVLQMLFKIQAPLKLTWASCPAFLGSGLKMQRVQANVIMSREK